MKKLEKMIFEICESLYLTGFNDGKYKIAYFPKPIKFKAKQIMDAITKQWNNN